MPGSGNGSSSSPQAPSEAVRQAAEDAVATLAAALAALKDSRDVSCPPPTRQQVQAGAHLLRTEVAKMGLLYTQSGAGSPPTDEESVALLNGFQRAAAALCMLYAGLAVAGGGPTLRASLHQTATSVVEACSSLIRGAVLGGARGPQLMVLSGFCLEMLEAAGRAPLDARAAIGRALTLVLKQLADAERELGEAVTAAEEEAAAPGDAAATADRTAAAAAGEVEGDGSLDDFGFGGEAFAAAHMPVARATLGLLRAVVGMVKAVVRRLLSERQGLAAEAVEGWESMLYHVKALAPLCDDLAASAYPPQDSGELASAAEALATSCELLLEECPEPGSPQAPPSSGPPDSMAAAGQASVGVQQGDAALQAAMGAVQQAHAALARELTAGGASTP